jgi:pimeloyl-ACP methyl ester carboxylesterase
MRSGASDARAHARTRPPVLFLTGIGLTAGVALRPIAELEAHFDVLVAPPTAEDALARLDTAGAEQAHVVGLSFGATIAQLIAIRHPGRVRSLVLGATTAGGELYFPPDRQVRDFLGRLDELPAEEGLWASVPYLYAAATCRHRARLIGEDVAEGLKRPLNPDDYRHHRAKARAHDVTTQLSEITAPTLVMHGQHDRILPLDNGRRLAAGIAGARFMPLKGGAHAFTTDEPDETTQLVSFLLEHSQRRRASPEPTRNGRATRA